MYIDYSKWGKFGFGEFQKDFEDVDNALRKNGFALAMNTLEEYNTLSVYDDKSGVRVFNVHMDDELNSVNFMADFKKFLSGNKDVFSDRMNVRFDNVFDMYERGIRDIDYSDIMKLDRGFWRGREI